MTIRGSSSIVTHPSSNQARRRSTALIRRSATCAASHGYRELRPRTRAEEMRRYIDELRAGGTRPGTSTACRQAPTTTKPLRASSTPIGHTGSTHPAVGIFPGRLLRDVERRVSEPRHFQHAGAGTYVCGDLLSPSSTCSSVVLRVLRMTLYTSFFRLDSCCFRAHIQIASRIPYRKSVSKHVAL